MGHFGVISPPLRGHLDPLLALSTELAARGHRVTVLAIGDAAPLLSGAPVGLHVVGRRSHPPGALRDLEAAMAGVSGLAGLPRVIREMVAATRTIVDEGPGACRALGIDAIIGDQTEAAAGLVARRLDLPYVSVASALPLNREPGIPPAFTGWRYEEGRWAEQRYRGGYRVGDILMRRHGDVIAETAAGWNLGTLRRIEDCASPFAQIAQLVPGLDWPRRELPATFHYVGPIRPREEIPPAPSGEGRTFVFASLGSLQGGRARLFRTIAGATERAGLHLVLAHGKRLTDRQIRGLPGRPTVHGFVPQREILPAARSAVLHGGLNTVLDALSARVPVVVLPIAFEQAAIARRVEWAGAGRMLNHRLLSRGRLAAAIRDVAETPSYRAAAARLAGEMAAAGGARRAADIVEQVLRTGRGATRPDLSGPPSTSGTAA